MIYMSKYFRYLRNSKNVNFLSFSSYPIIAEPEMPVPGHIPRAPEGKLVWNETAFVYDLVPGEYHSFDPPGK